MKYIVALFCIVISQNPVLASNNKCEPPPSSWWKTGWAATVYSGPLTSQITSRMFSNADFSHSGILAFGLAKKIGSVLEDRLNFELEAVAVQHFGEQKHFEIVPISIIFRWRSFPWNNTLFTTLAIGDGVSIATQLPNLEARVRGAKSARTVNYLMAEVTFSLPSCPNWALVGRYHHRSGIFGTYFGVHDASTAFAAGVKYWF
ncbi:MAG: hypothetical protein HYX35_05875 [Proteobacteria bacterium]|nr:hypothetical protein [Pseudomonadota bacterium]